MASFFDYYGGRPSVPSPVVPVPSPAPPSVTPGQGPLDPRYMLRRQYREEDPTEPDYRFKLIGGTNPALDVSAIQVINPEDVIHGDFNTYLESVGMDRSGKFSGAVMKETSGTKDTSAAAADFVGTVETAAGMIMGMSNVVGGPSLTDPTGVGTRSTGSGIFSPIATANMSREFTDINAIAKFNSDPANKGATGNQRGFMLRLGDERGSILYRLPGENRYRGDLSLRGINIPQDVARNIENYTLGVDKGQQLLNAISSGDTDIVDKISGDIDLSNAVIKAGRGGYTLDGKFNFVTGVGRMGNLSDLTDENNGLAGTTFRVTTEGGYNAIESQRIAKSWLNGARNFTSDTPAAVKVAHLQAHIQMATKASDAMTSAKSTKKPDPVVTTTTGGDGGTPPGPPPGFTPAGGGDGDGGPTVQGPSFEGGTTTYYDDQGYQTDPGGGGGGGASYSVNEIEQDIMDSFGGSTDAADYSFEGFKEGGLNTARPGFVEDEDRIVPDQSVLTVNELQGDVAESGFIDRPPSQVTDAESVADDIPMPEAEEDGFVINQEAVKLAGEMDLIKKIEDAERYVKSKGIELNKPKQPILASSGEIYVRPEVVGAIGLDELEKINKRGVPKTKKKIKRTQRA